ncbi:hypothetical protein Bsub01_04276 [Bacillus subtilis]|nr:hypothetical protein AWV81_09870 [Bacillus subtilis subsp. natto]API42117.1 hypothetical protein BSR08_06105 [Bacillus subtilis]ASB69891.1 hypothetical protein S100333_01998 [Bacillus subtilis subsp. subtilis]API94828.1 hypothetical protein BKP58_02465 [Bacillus subtilis]ARI88432.1 hypothetical protein B7470_21440 [Bacillus subtilis]
MNLNKIRSMLSKSAKILGDVNAAKNDTLGKRIARRSAGKATNKLLRSLFKSRENILRLSPKKLYLN